MPAATTPVFDKLRFENTFVEQLPADEEDRNYTRQVQAACYSRVAPTPVSSPALLACAREVADLLDLPVPETADERDAFARVFSGNEILPGMATYAACYGGHQFGNWAGQLGDGRAIGLGEVVNSKGQRWELQLKGAGPTPYSRHSDGRAVLRSSLREFLCSEAMHHLGVPTTRALSLVKTGDPVVRDMLYDGNPQAEPGAIVCRVAPTFLRFGNFEIFRSRRDEQTLRSLLDYTLRTHFPHLGPTGPQSCAAFFSEVCRSTAVMIDHWMRVGFVHGVMNTDNMSILGLTIDYGPYGWIDNYDPDWTPNTTDAGGRRYRFGHQPQIALWNLVRLADALLPFFENIEVLQESLKTYATTLMAAQEESMAGKLGLVSLHEEDTPLVNELYENLQLVETDMTIYFRNLANLDVAPERSATTPDDDLVSVIADAFYTPDSVTPEIRSRHASWLRRYLQRTLQDDAAPGARVTRMNAHNPKYVLRNYLAQQAIDRATEGDTTLLQETLDVLRRPYEEQPGRASFAQKRPEWARHKVGCSALSCSS